MAHTTIQQSTGQDVREKLSRVSRLEPEIMSRVMLFGREEEIRAAILALITKHHAVLIGPPGVAKSELVRELANAIGARYFEKLLTRFTEPEELFGPVDVKALRESGEFRRITRGSLVEAEIAFLDEVFKASSSILNTMLAIMNERIYHEAGNVIRVPLWSLYGASNEVPSEDETRAFYDRFLLRVFVKPLEPKDWFSYINFYINKHRSDKQLNPIPFDVIKEANSLLRSVDLTPIYQSYLTIVKRFADATNTQVSDRRLARGLWVVAASSLLRGSLRADPIDLSGMIYVLPETPEHADVARKAVEDVAGRIISARREVDFVKKQLIDLVNAVRNTRDIDEHAKLLKNIATAKSKINQLRNILGDEATAELQEIMREIEEAYAAVAEELLR